MSRNKLKRFAENQAFPHVLEPTRKEILQGYSWRGQWSTGFFKNENPLILELGCGKGEYTVAMARKFPEVNFIGMDVKGARIWYGAREVEEHQMANAAFLRTQIELIDRCFAPGEVSEIWITFPDPQIKHKRAKHRLTGPGLLQHYQSILKPEGQVHLKTDSEFLHGYTAGILEVLGHPVYEAWYDIDFQVQDKTNLLHEVRTHYEEQFREKGKPITYLRFGFNQAHGN